MLTLVFVILYAKGRLPYFAFGSSLWSMVVTFILALADLFIISVLLGLSI